MLRFGFGFGGVRVCCADMGLLLKFAGGDMKEL